MNEAQVRITVFITVLVCFVVLENIIPEGKNQPKTSMPKRWFNHIGMVLVGNLLSRLMLPLGLVGVALYSQKCSLGLFNNVHLPYFVEIILGVMMLDLVIYWQHRLFHKIPVLWLLHRVHHIDPNLDVTSALRFHPLEIVLSLIVKSAVVVAIGLPLEAIVVFEVALSSFALFNHSNIAIPSRLEKVFRYLLVTPSLHRIHHSVLIDESNTNFGFSITLWDRVFGTYKDNSVQTLNEFKTGVNGFEGNDESTLSLLINPFKH
jgi:sterol desaturase/sphingolipid hydroxylase (fatty acid hydroxylase superfamily)